MSQKTIRYLLNFVTIGGTLFWSMACNAPAADPGIPLGSDQVSGSPAPIPPGSDQSTNTPEPPSSGEEAPDVLPPGDDDEEDKNPVPDPVVGESCHSSDPHRFCVALKYVVYRDSTDLPIVSQDDAIANIAGINSVWSRCDIAFQIDQFLAVKPSDYGLRYQTANYSELDDIRETFVETSTLLVVTTGTWDRTGSLGSTGANAWTTLPGTTPYGAILERPVGTYSNIIAHELGHFMNLGHASDTSNLMNPIIYGSSVNLYNSQCESARQAINYFWKKMLR